MNRTVAAFFKGPDLPQEVRPTYQRHLAYVVFQALAEGILANAPVMAIKGMGSPNWQMALEKSISSIGLFLVLYLGGIMAVRRKMPFIFFPGLAYAFCSLLMGFTDNVLFFLILAGIGTLFDCILRPAIAAVVRFNYPVTHRGAAVGEIRKWSSIVFLAASLLSAWLLDLVADHPRMMIKGQMFAAAILLATGFIIFRTLRVNENPSEFTKHADAGFFKPFKDSLRIVREDARLRRYLAIGFLYVFGGMTYASFIPVLLTKDLRFSYVGATMLIHVIPALLTFFTTGYVGRWIDRVSTWKAWAWVRLSWGIDGVLLAGAPLIGAWFPPAAAVLPFIARLFRGFVQGGSYILWWEVAVNHFAPPGGDTTRYMGIVLFLTGIGRLSGPLFGAWLITTTNTAFVMLIGASTVILSALLCFLERYRERKEERLRNMENFEMSFE